MALLFSKDFYTVGRLVWSVGINMVMVKKMCYICTVCAKEVSRGVKYCADCRKGKIGGYREGSGRAKSGYYKGFYCGSTYELCWLIYQLDNGVIPERFETVLEYGGHKYVPDFRIGNTIFEMKGFESQNKVDLKSEVAVKNGFEIVVLRKEDLEHCFKWVSENYTRNYESLYDGFVPKYKLSCFCCGAVFYRQRKPKTEKVFCSRSCSMKDNRVSSGINRYTNK